ncbi:MAG: maltose alpha-D-glucosyltransferase [Sphingomonadaceae bacterium]
MIPYTEGGARSGGDHLWYKDAIIYELTVRGFYDSNGDGIGDFPGLTQKLDYIQDLGATAIWLLPFYPSPLRDDGYDIADYTGVNPIYGTLRDVRLFIREAHRRGLRIITELVCNHTSDAHPWFQRARRAGPGTASRNYYVWSEDPDRYREARIIFKDFENSNWSWDPAAEAYYWHRFYSHQPDLNYDSPQVRKAIFRVMDFWLQMGVDGLRLDAVPYLFEREGTNCENLPETHAFLKELRRHVDATFRNRMLLAEANQWPEQAVAYFGDGDECHMAFHFPLMPRMFMAIRMEDRFPIEDIIAQTPPIPENCQWALFLRNHDELTLEMVTDEERDYMYRVYASDPVARINLGIRRRLAPLLGNNRRRIELMNGLLFSLPGTPVVYYGDEIGMGDNIYLGDRNGVRTPMQWSADRNGGFSRANPQRLYLPVISDPEYNYEAIQAETQQNNPSSLLWWMKRLIALRKQYRAFSRGSLRFLHPENRKVLAFLRSYQSETILVVANLSRHAQYVQLDLGEYRGMVPVETFGGVPFPAIGDAPYFLTLGSHSFYWFSLEPEEVALQEVRPIEPKARISTLSVSGSWRQLLQERGATPLTEVLPSYLQVRRWFGGKARRIQRTRILDTVLVPFDDTEAYVTLIEVSYAEGDAETYQLFITFSTGEEAERLLQEMPHTVVARVRTMAGTEEGVLHDALVIPGFTLAMLRAIPSHRRLRGAEGSLVGTPVRSFRGLREIVAGPLEPSPLKVEQSNSSVAYSDRLVMKLFRKLEPGVNPDLEMGRFLTDRGFPHTPPTAGSIEYRREQREPFTVAILQGHVRNEGDAWSFTLDSLGRYFETAVASEVEAREVAGLVSSPLSAASLLDLATEETPDLALGTIGAYLESAHLMGRRTAELHLALASDLQNPSFAPEPFTTLYQRSIYQSMRALARSVFQRVARGLAGLPEEVQADARAVLDAEPAVIKRFRSVMDRKITAVRTRCHGDYHLGQLLYTGSDFVIIDFEGEPARPLSERRIKRSPIRDVAGMLRSFHYASHAALLGQTERVGIRPEDVALLRPWARYWHRWVSATFLKAYLQAAEGAPFLPRGREELEVLLDVFLLEKVVYELDYEVNNRPTWAAIPIQGILQLMEVEG